jgi:hypothetical protein
MIKVPPNMGATDSFVGLASSLAADAQAVRRRAPRVNMLRETISRTLTAKEVLICVAVPF